MNAVRLLDIDEAAEMLHCSVAKVRQMVIGDRTLAAVHEDYQGFRDTFELRGLRLFDVDDLGAITDVRTNRPAGFLRFDLAEVVRVLSEQAHWEANAAPLSGLFHPALGESESSALACGEQPLMALSPTPAVADTAEQRQDRRPIECEAAGGGSAQLWTPERVAEAKKMRGELRRSGVKDFAAQTARHFSVSPTRLREVLRKNLSRPVGAPVGGVFGWMNKHS